MAFVLVTYTSLNYFLQSTSHRLVFIKQINLLSKYNNPRIIVQYII